MLRIHCLPGLRPPVTHMALNSVNGGQPSLEGLSRNLLKSFCSARTTLLARHQIDTTPTICKPSAPTTSADRGGRGKQAMESKQQQLIAAYRQTLSDLPLHWLDRSREHEADFKHLSALFLPGTSPLFEQAAKRIMVVGRETRRWNVLTAGKPFIDLDEYIQRAMAIQQRHLAKYIQDIFSMWKRPSVARGPRCGPVSYQEYY